MSHSNRTRLPEGYLWGWENTGERQPIASADPNMELQPPTDQGYMPNAQTTPPPPDVWMASTPQNDQLQQLLRAIQVLRAGT